MMNMFSPFMPDPEFDKRLKWLTAQGCNTADLLISNERDGLDDYAGYCPYGAKWGTIPDIPTLQLMFRRIIAIRETHKAVRVWMLSDDGPTYNNRSLEEYIDYFRLCGQAGLFLWASMACLGIEVNEYLKLEQLPKGSSAAKIAEAVKASTAKVSTLAKQLNQISGLPVGIHQTSGRVDFSQVCGEICMLQLSASLPVSKVRAACLAAVAKVHKPTILFESGPRPNREKCLEALKDGPVLGPFGVGNW